MDNKQVYFRKLNLDEKTSKLAQLAKSSESRISFWSRGSENKNSCIVSSFDSKNLVFGIVAATDELIKSKDLLFTFYVNKVQYFGEGTISEDSSGRISFSCEGEVFKTEKRESFRLLSYPHHEIYFLVEVEKKDTSASKVINIKTGKHEEELFDSFLDLISSGSEIKSGFAKFRVIDISVTGLAFQYDTAEEEFIKTLVDKKKKVVIDFEGKEIPIGEFEFIYTSRKQSGDKTLKAGIRYKNLPLNTEETIGLYINKTMRK